MNDRVEVKSSDGLAGGRGTAWTILTVLFALIFGIALFGWLGLFLGWTSGGEDQIHRVHEIGSSGVLTGMLVAFPLLLLARRRDDIALLQLIAVVGVAAAIASLIATDWVFLAFAPILAVPIVVLLAVSRGWSALRARGLGLVPPMLIAALVSAPFWIAFALTTARYQRTGDPNDPHVMMHHWSGMAAMGIALLLAAVLASFRTRGWRWVAWAAGVGAAVYGLASAVFATYPGTSLPYPGSEGVGWGLLAIAWGIGVISVAEIQLRREAFTA